MNGFQETEIGLIPEDWEVVPFLDAIVKTGIKVGKVERGRYKAVGTYPIVDQGQNHIAGYWNNQSDVYQGLLPVVIFGDHTRIFKFVTFPFVCGADGTKVLVPNRNNFEPTFLFYALLNLKIPSRGYNRHFPLLKEQRLARPPLPEQKKIAAILSAVQEAKEKTEQVIKATKELKKSLMKHLFTYGSVPVEEAERVSLKETEIGLVPEEWEMVKLGDVADIKYGYRTAIPKSSADDGIPIITMAEMTQDGSILWSKIRKIKVDMNIINKHRLARGEVLFNWRNSPDHIGKTAVFDSRENIPYICASFILRVIPNERIADSCFIHYFISLLKSKGYFAMKSRRAVGQTNFNATVLRNLPICCPQLPIQQRVAQALSVLDRKVESEEDKKKALEELFKTLLNTLMAGKIRVNDLEIKE